MRVLTAVVEYTFMSIMLYMVQRSAGWVVAGTFLYIFITLMLIGRSVTAITEVLKLMVGKDVS